MKHKFIFCLFFVFHFLSVETLPKDFEQSPVDYALWGLIPGLGQFLLGNSVTGSLQLGIFLTFMGSGISMTNRSDYIPIKERIIKFKIEDVILADYLEKNGFLYREFPLLSESQYERIHRMVQYKKLVEINPFLENGSYERHTYATVGSELLIQSAQHVIFYSVYSSYRDAGGITFASNEEYIDLAMAPFQPRFLLNKKFLIPIGIALLYVGYETNHPPKNPQQILLYPGMKTSGFMGFYTTVISFNAGVSEEALFRGFLNHYLIHKWEFEKGLLASSIIFGLAHLGNSVGNALFATLAGAYLGYIHYKENWDIRQGIAIHFWWDVIIIALSLRYMKEDPNVLKNTREIFFMPIQYQLKF